MKIIFLIICEKFNLLKEFREIMIFSNLGFNLRISEILKKCFKYKGPSWTNYSSFNVLYLKIGALLLFEKVWQNKIKK